MTNQTKNSHYVARHLTTPWEFGQRKLWVYDFQDDKFSIVSSKRLLTTEEPWDQKIEDFLSKYLESPLSSFLARFNKNRDDSNISQNELRAIKLAIMLQVPRSSNDTDDLSLLVERGEAYLDEFVAGLDHVFTFVHVPLRTESLCFPEHGLIMVPLVGAAPALAVALHPSYLTVAIPNPAEKFLPQIETYHQGTVDTFSVLSVGLDACRRVVLPGSAQGLNDEQTMRAQLKLNRTSCKRLTQMMLDETTALLGTALPPPPMLRGTES